MNIIKPRKISLEPANKQFLKGPLMCGKSALAKAAFKNAQLIDLADLRTNLEDLKHIKSPCVLLNAKPNHLELINHKELSHCIITSTSSLKIEGFKHYELDYLDYEEFCSFYSGHNALADYLLRGRTPAAALNIQDARLVQARLIAAYGLNITRVLKALCEHVAKKLSIAKIFSAYTYKIGKNDFYSAINFLEQEGLIFFISEHTKPNNKKLFLADFALKNALSASKNFSATFSNLIACELRSCEADFTFSKEFDFITNEYAIVQDAFLDPDFARLKMRSLAKAALNLGIKKVLILSLNVSFSAQIGLVQFYALKLEEWLFTKEEVF